MTGAAGFIGSHFIKLLLRERPSVRVIAVDALTYAGNRDNLKECLRNPRLMFVHANICDAEAMDDVFSAGVDAVVNFAAETHVDRIILGNEVLWQSNVIGVQILLDHARGHGVGRFLQISTDEVYGALGPEGRFTEQSPLQPRNPYSASKAAADHMVASYYHTYGMPVLITRCSNNYGPNQFPEKMIPLFITNLLEGRKVPLYGDGQHVRDWIHVEDHCRAVLAVLESATPGSVYNIGGNADVPNIEIVRRILKELNCDESMVELVRDRSGHDRRYAVDISRISNDLGWQPTVQLDDGLRTTVQWYQANKSWWGPLRRGAFQSYYEQQYGSPARDCKALPEEI